VYIKHAMYRFSQH